MTKLPQQLNLNQMQNQWATAIDPLLRSPLSNNVFLPNVSLQTGANVVNHLLGRKLQGWFITRIRAASTIFDTQDTNQLPQFTLNLTASAPVVIDLVVF